MTLIKRISIQGFRGVLATMTLDMTKNGRPCSTLIYGRNGTGKSSITDAWEWFYSQKVEHLSREGAGHSSFPNFLCGDQDCFVEVEFSDQALGILRLSFDKNKITKPKETGNFELLRSRIYHPCHIRFADLTRFVYLTKGERYDLLAQLMGFHSQVETQKTLRKVERQLQEKASRQEGKVSQQKKKLRDVFSKDILTIGDLTNELKGRIEKYNSNVEPTLTSLKTTSETIKGHLKQDPNASRLQNLKTIVSDIRGIKSQFIDPLKAETYLAAVQSFKEQEESVAKLLLIDLYSRGIETINSLGQTEQCPLCEQEYTGDLLSDLGGRLDKLSDFKARYDHAKTTQKAAKDGIPETLGSLNRLKTHVGDFGEDSFWITLRVLENTLNDTNEILRTLSPYLRISVEEIAKEDLVEILGLTTKLKEQLKLVTQHQTEAISNIQALIQDLENDAHRRCLVEDYDALSKAISLWAEFENEEDGYSRIKGVSTRFSNEVNQYVSDCLKDVELRFNDISSDVATFFRVLEADSIGLGDPVLKIDTNQDRSVLPEVLLHGHHVSPAYKYLSESQLNSFGLSVFLASVKRFNKSFRFIILDDVVNSLDGYKRPRLLQLIREHFSDHQILLFTHDSVWKDRLTREFSSWQRYHFKRHEVNIGPVLDSLKNSLEEVESLLDDDNPSQAGRLLGPLLESDLQRLCESFQVELKYNTRNEYTIAPLLDGLTARATKKLKNHPLIDSLHKLKAEIGFRNLCSHAKNPEIDITPEEIRIVLELWKDILVITQCSNPKCGEFARWKDPTFGCACGQVELKQQA